MLNWFWGLRFWSHSGIMRKTGWRLKAKTCNVTMQNETISEVIKTVRLSEGRLTMMISKSIPIVLRWKSVEINQLCTRHLKKYSCFLKVWKQFLIMYKLFHRRWCSCSRRINLSTNFSYKIVFHCSLCDPRRDQIQGDTSTLSQPSGKMSLKASNECNGKWQLWWKTFSCFRVHPEAWGRIEHREEIRWKRRMCWEDFHHLS